MKSRACTAARREMSMQLGSRGRARPDGELGVSLYRARGVLGAAVRWISNGQKRC